MLEQNECVHCYCDHPNDKETVSINGEPQPVAKEEGDKIFYTTKEDIERGRQLRTECQNDGPSCYCPSPDELKEIQERKKDDVINHRVREDSNVHEQDEKSDGIDPDNPLGEASVKQIEALLKQASEMVKTMEGVWLGTKHDFSLKDVHMKSLYQYNETHKKEKPKGLSDEEEAQWDHFNGFNDITDDEIEEIFGKDHPIIGVEKSQTIDRIKMAMGDYITWLSSLKEYKQINDAYMRLVDMEEEKKIKELEDIIEREEDPAAKELMQKSINEYYSRKYLEFLGVPLSEIEIATLVKNYNDQKKLEYYTNRAIDKLKQLKVTAKFIFEISKFEKRFLPEEYHGNSNILLLWFMQKIIFSDLNSTDERSFIMCFIICMDKIVRNSIDSVTRERVMDNIKKFEDQFIGKLNK